MKGQLQQSPPFWLTKGFLHPRDRARHIHIKAQELIFHPVLGGIEADSKEELGILRQQRRSWNLPSWRWQSRGHGGEEKGSAPKSCIEAGEGSEPTLHFHRIWKAGSASAGLAGTESPDP